MTNKWKHQTLSLIGLLICSPLFVQLQQSCVLWSNETGTGGEEQNQWAGAEQTAEMMEKCKDN